MKDKPKTMYTANTVSDILYHLKTVPSLRIYGGCTGIDTEKNSHIIDLETPSIITRNIPELCRINKTVRYIEFGSAVTLSQIASIDRKWIPQGLYEAIQSIGNPYTANLATIGGNICTKKHRMTCFAPLLAHDAKLGIRSMSRNTPEETYISISKFDKVPEKSFVSKIRIPLEEWNVAIFKKMGTTGHALDSASFIFLANTQKGILSDVRIAFCGSFSFRNRELENGLIGNKLPLTERGIIHFVETAKEYFIDYCENEDINILPIYYAYFTNLLFDSLRSLS